MSWTKPCSPCVLSLTTAMEVNDFSRAVWVFRVWFTSTLLTMTEEWLFLGKMSCLDKKTRGGVLVTSHYRLISFIWRSCCIQITEITSKYIILVIYGIHFEKRIVFFKNLKKLSNPVFKTCLSRTSPFLLFFMLSDMLWTTIPKALGKGFHFWKVYTREASTIAVIAMQNYSPSPENVLGPLAIQKVNVTGKISFCENICIMTLFKIYFA